MYLCGDSMLWSMGFALHVCTYLQSLPDVGKCCDWGSPPGDALQLSTRGHSYFTCGSYVHMACLLQNRVKSTIMSLSMLLPVWCSRPDISQGSSRSKAARAAVGEHLSSKLMMETWPVCLKLVLISTPSILLRRSLAFWSEQTWALTKHCCNLFVPVSIIMG